jgi:perosamine synthetase
VNEIPFHRPSIGAEEQAAVAKVLASGWLTTGPVAQQFEREFAEYVGSRHAVAVNSATAALHLALDAIGLRAGDEVLLPSYTFAATAEVVTYFGGVPVLCDSEPGGFNIDVADAERRMTPRTKAIIPVHIAGKPCDMDQITQMAARHNLHVIEDAAHALPAKWRGRRIGSISEITAFSFYATKTITTAEGGMLTTNDEQVARRAAMMRLHGIAGDAWKRYSNAGNWYYEVMAAGFKCNLPDVLAAIGLAQLQKSNAMHQRRLELAQRYLSRFGRLEELELPPAGDGHAWHLFIARLRTGAAHITRDEMIAALKQAGIGTSVHFIPLHLHPFYRDQYGYRRGDFPHAEAAYEGAISLPIYPDLSDDEAERVMSAVETVLWNQRRTASTAA